MIPGVPQEMPEWVRSPRDARHWLACEYRRAGYSVTEDPNPADLPPALAELLKTLPRWRFDMIVLPVSTLATAPNPAHNADVGPARRSCG